MIPSSKSVVVYLPDPMETRKHSLGRARTLIQIAVSSAVSRGIDFGLVGLARGIKSDLMHGDLNDRPN